MLNGTTTQIYENTKLILSGSIIVSQNASLTFTNSIIQLEANNDYPNTYEVKGDGQLIITNSEITGAEFSGIRARDQAQIIIHNSTIFQENTLNDRPYYTRGFGLSGYSKITVHDSTIGYLRFADRTSGEIFNSIIGEFETRSMTESTVTDSTLKTITINYDQNWIWFNGTLTGTHQNFRPEDIVKAGEIRYPFTLINTVIETPPSLDCVDSNLEANNTELDMVLIHGDSGTKLRDSTIGSMYLGDYVWASLINTKADRLHFTEGDFNLKLSNSTIGAVTGRYIYGLNLQIINSRITDLRFSKANFYAPYNIEIMHTVIDNLYLTQDTPPIYKFHNTTIMDTLDIESIFIQSTVPTLTGTLRFSENITLIQTISEGTTSINRVYMVRVTDNGTPASNQSISITTGNKTRTIQTNPMGVAIFTQKYSKTFQPVQDPPPGGPYTTDMNNLTTQIKLTINQQDTYVGLLSNTPIIIELNQETPDQEPGLNKLFITTILLASGITAIFLVMRKGVPSF